MKRAWLSARIASHGAVAWREVEIRAKLLEALCSQLTVHIRLRVCDLQDTKAGR